jgi:hypothetical protein
MNKVEDVKRRLEAAFKDAIDATTEMLPEPPLNYRSIQDGTLYEADQGQMFVAGCYMSQEIFDDMKGWEANHRTTCAKRDRGAVSFVYSFWTAPDGAFLDVSCKRCKAKTEIA